MRESLLDAKFVFLSADDYLADFSVRFSSPGQDLWKMERQQTFQEPGYPTWDAFAEGRVADAIALAEDGRPEIEEYQRKLSARGVRLYRIRLVATPPTPYLWWESHILRIRSAAGEYIRALDLSAVSDVESRDWTLPEVVTIGTRVMYLVQYTPDGVLSGARRYEHSALIEQWLAFMQQLFARGEPFAEFYEREIKDAPEFDDAG